MTEPIPARVQHGARLLDERLPGWVDRIDLDRLDLASGCNCILGQELDDEVDRAAGDATDYLIFTGYDVAVIRWFDLDEDKSADHGFTTEEGENEFAELTAAWRELILARRAGAPS